MTRTQLDARHLTCPLPILKTKKALRDVGVGEEIEVLATDPNTAADMTAFCEARGHVLVSHEETDGAARFIVRRGR
ncbi:MAG: sulfurtransferase TusA family protein [Pseudomonadota bacterium]